MTMLEPLCVRCIMKRQEEVATPFPVMVVSSEECSASHASGRDTIDITTDVLLDVRSRRQEQDLKWGENQCHDPIEWMGIITEEVGDMAKAAMRLHFNIKNPDAYQYRDELLDVAASAVAAVENMDREGGI